MAHPQQRDMHPLSVILPGKPPATLEKNIAPKRDDTDIDKMGNKFSLSKRGISLAVDLRYFSLDELDERPIVIQDIPEDPPELRDLPQGGKLILRLWINEEGKVVNAEPVSSELPKAFIDSARNGFLMSRFAPGRIHGNAVGTVMDVVLNYAPRE